MSDYDVTVYSEGGGLVDGYDSVAAAVGDTLCLWWEEPGPQVMVVYEGVKVAAVLISGPAEQLGNVPPCGVVTVAFIDGRVCRYLVEYVTREDGTYERTAVTPHRERDRDVWTPQQDTVPNYACGAVAHKLGMRWGDR